MAATMSNLASGHVFGIATPHFKSSMMGMQDYLLTGAGPGAAISAALSLTYNLPHLCGLGGDAIIMQASPGNLEVFNGTGVTGTHQHHDNYLYKGLESIPRRGIYSTMVYGCPSAYERYTQLHDIDLNRVFKHLHEHDLKHGLITTESLLQGGGKN
jgi:gamma-glutamyltranspeptidase